MRITENSINRVSLVPGRSYVMFVAGAFSGGDVTLTFTDATITGVVFMPGHAQLTGPAAFVFTAPAPHLTVEVRNASSPDIIVDCILRPL